MSRRKPMRIAIAGGGFSGLCVAVHCHRYAVEPLEIDLYEATGALCNGPAFAWRSPEHVLNGEAAHLSVFEETRDDFVRWLRHSAAAAPFLQDDLPVENQFVPRFLFADYAREALEKAVRAPGPCTIRVHRHSEIVDAVKHDGGVLIVLADGRRSVVDRVVVATGNSLPRPLFSGVEGAVCIENPWDRSCVERIPHGPVLMIGTGQTMVDMSVALRAAGHEGLLQAVSRRGVVPQTHLYGLGTRDVDAAKFPRTMREIVRFVREEAARAQSDGVDWRCVTSAVRPLSCEVWPELPTREKVRFFRRVAPYWWGYRQRVAPQVGSRFSAMIHEGRVVVYRGSVVRIDPGMDAVRVTLSSGCAERTVVAKTLINCTGLGQDQASGTHPLLRNLMRRGDARRHATGVGLDVAANLALIATDGRSSDGLFTLGANTRGAFLETLAIRDIRKQSRALATTLLKRAEASAESTPQFGSAVDEKTHTA
ncbi:FAD/NAD(P)-binding protein [Burkholderia sp.]|jgi:uncharacterized NAD(P)/FAD-binding protein YdhS|uniref:FAD/NAD(P)-binding protein n=1 Tax=Burkholderia sp. TaxID=36773 RepID=UPI00258DA9DF|nr:FAD/NAD(P)-binding protein [Burkholderia sp.]MCA3930474.1 FAD/NAD(P)-binding protein [Burkholderia sp.]